MTRLFSDMEQVAGLAQCARRAPEFALESGADAIGLLPRPRRGCRSGRDDR